eukprot:10989181-Karenia_brevis.AAC.1
MWWVQKECGGSRGSTGVHWGPGGPEDTQGVQEGVQQGPRGSKVSMELKGSKGSKGSRGSRGSGR